jgi:hypothetical protein
MLIDCRFELQMGQFHIFRPAMACKIDVLPEPDAPNKPITAASDWKLGSI